MSPPAAWPDAVTFAAAWQRAVDAHAQQSFLIFERADGSAHEWTYAAFDSLVARAAHALAARGVAQGSAVHLALANAPAFVAA